MLCNTQFSLSTGFFHEWYMEGFEQLEAYCENMLISEIMVLNSSDYDLVHRQYTGKAFLPHHEY